MLDQALQALPADYRPDPKDPDTAQVLIRSDSAGATYGFAAWPESSDSCVGGQRVSITRARGWLTLSE